jgi:dolichyl-phosphate-mannose--protein O-mannosyl transferase
MGTLVGVLMLPAFYLIAKGLFGGTPAAFCATTLFAFDFMHFVQTRIATIDVYTVFFILFMYLFMWRYVTSGYETPFYKTALPLFLSGLFFGIGAATKWQCIYAGLGLCALYVLYLVMRGRHAAAQGKTRAYIGFLFKTLFASILFFIVIPFGIYFASYIPYARASGDVTLARVFDEMWRNQSYMFNYHSKLVDTHPYSAAWYTWLFDIRPILYYLSDQGAVKTAFGSFGNPFVWWGGLACLGLTVWRFIRKRDPAALFIVVGYLSQMLPWILVPRLTFVYHYFPATVFLCLALGYVFSDYMTREPVRRRLVYAYTAVSVGAFILFYPVLAGITVPTWYTAYLIKWLPSWPF